MDPSNDGREGDSEIFGHVGGWSAIGENQAGRNNGLSGVSEGPQSEIAIVEGAGEGYGVLHRAPGPADISQGHLHGHPKSPALPLRVRSGNGERNREDSSEIVSATGPKNWPAVACTSCLTNL